MTLNDHICLVLEILSLEWVCIEWDVMGDAKAKVLVVDDKVDRDAKTSLEFDLLNKLVDDFKVTEVWKGNEG